MIFFSSFCDQNYIFYGKGRLHFRQKSHETFLNKMHIQLPNLCPLQDVTKKLKVSEKSQKYATCALGTSESRQCVFRECTVVYSSSSMSNNPEEFSP